MLSLDVKYLFLNIPIKGALDCLEKRLREFHYSFIEIEEILCLVHLCVRQTVFVFNGVFCSQIEGLGMENPLSPQLCDIYVHYFEETLQGIDTSPMRYENDIFVLDPSNILIF